MNWIQTQGNFFKIEKDLIKYVPKENLENFSHEKGKNGPFSGKIKCSEFFESGNISFLLNFDQQDAFFNLFFSNSDVQISLNSGASRKAFCIKGADNSTSQKGYIIYDQNIDKGSLLLNHDYQLEVQVTGSVVKLFVDSVQICLANVSNVTRDQINIAARSKGEILIKTFRIKTKKPKVFVVMQFSDDYNNLYNQVIRPVCEAFGYECFRGDEYFTTGSILKDIIDAINEAAIIIADITPNNPNVFYEVGYSHALQKPTILLSDKKRDKLPFDVSGFRTLFYDNTIGGKSEVEERLKKHLESIQTT